MMEGSESKRANCSELTRIQQDVFRSSYNYLGNVQQSAFEFKHKDRTEPSM